MTPPPPNLSRSTIVASVYLSPRRRYILTRLSEWYRLKRDSSLKTTWCQLIRRWWFWAQILRSCRWRLVRTGPWYGRRQLIPNCLRRLDIVRRCTCRPRLPMVTTAVDCAVKKRSRRWHKRIYRSWRCDVTLGCPGLGRSATVPVCLKRRTRRTTVDLDTLKRRAASSWLIPASSKPKILFRSSLLSRGISENGLMSKHRNEIDKKTAFKNM